MNSVEKFAHCRLCATLKSCAELVNLVLKEEMRNSIINKLNRFNINLNFNSTDDRLPWTVCLTCINSLDKAFDFVLEVEEAQKVLENLIDVEDIKTEIQVSDDDLYESSLPVLDVSVEIKSENDTQFQTAEVESEVLKTSEPKLKRVEDPDCDTQSRESNHSCTGNETLMTPEELEKHSNSSNKDLQIQKLPIKAKQSINDRLTCTICQKSFKYKASLRNHLNLIHTDWKIEQHTCEICGKTFSEKHNLERHMRNHDDRQRYSCEICNLKFRTYTHLKQHLGTHDGLKPFKCDQCSRCFRLKRHLMNHSVTHTDSKPYVCTYCNKSFYHQTSHGRHIRRKHTGVDKPWSCQQCKQQFTNWLNYKQHMKTSHSAKKEKKKRIRKRVYPIDPVTGEQITYKKKKQMNKKSVESQVG